MSAGDAGPVHTDAGQFFDIVNGCQDGHIGIPLAAAWAAYLAEFLQRTGCHQIGMSPCLVHQRGGAGDYGHEHTCADGRTTGAPEPACASRNLAPPADHFLQGLGKVDLTSCIRISRQKSAADHYMMLRPMHMTLRHIHHLADDGNRIGRSLAQAQPDNLVHALGMALIADIVAIDTPGLAHLPLAADAAFHHHILAQILERSPAYKTFFFHRNCFNR